MERVKGIEPSSQPWEGHVLPLNHTRALGHGRQARDQTSFYQTAARLATGLHGYFAGAQCRYGSSLATRTSGNRFGFSSRLVQQ